MARAPRTGTCLALPTGAAPPYSVYVNGVERREGTDYTVSDNCLHFTDPLTCSQREGLWKKVVMSTAGFGFYAKADLVDVHYTDHDGQPGIASGLQVEPDNDASLE